MADVFDTNVGELASQATSVVSGYVWPVVWSLVGITIFLVFFWYMLHRHKVRIRLLTSQNGVPYDDKAREIQIDGVPFWKLLKRKDIIPIPPRQALSPNGRDLFGKPKFYTEMYWSDEYGYISALEDVTKKNFLEKLEIVDEGGVNQRVARDTFRPFTTQQRALLVNQFAKASARKKKSLMDQITQIAVPVALIGLVMMGLVFWEDIAKPAKEMGAVNLQMLETQQAMLSQAAEITTQNARTVQALGDANTQRELEFQQFIRATGGSS